MDERVEALRFWAESAPVYQAVQDRGDPNRTILLDPVMLELCGDVRGLNVLDLGCGEGRFCRMLSERGATVIGFDITHSMLQAARSRGDGRDGYVAGDASALPFRDARFDLVVSYVTLVDIADYRRAISETARVLRPGGTFVVANLGFVTASQGWQRDEAGRRLYQRVDRYAEERKLVMDWPPDPDAPETRIRIINWHRPLSAYMSAFLAAGLLLRDFLEPVPGGDSLREHPYFEDWYRVPEFWVMRWEMGNYS